MTDVTEDRSQAEAELSAADEQVLRELTERARTGGLKLTGDGGLLGRLTKMVIEGALEGELDDHLGYGKRPRRTPAIRTATRRATRRRTHDNPPCPDEACDRRHDPQRARPWLLRHRRR
jgi:putative transposase